MRPGNRENPAASVPPPQGMGSTRWGTENIASGLRSSSLGGEGINPTGPVRKHLTPFIFHLICHTLKRTTQALQSSHTGLRVHHAVPPPDGTAPSSSVNGLPQTLQPLPSFAFIMHLTRKSSFQRKNPAQPNLPSSFLRCHFNFREVTVLRTSLSIPLVSENTETNGLPCLQLPSSLSQWLLTAAELLLRMPGTDVQPAATPARSQPCL